MDKQKILIIDDDPRNIFALKATLHAYGYDTVAAGDANEGIRLFREEEGISIVLLDMMMPGLDGYHALPMLRNVPDKGNVPIIAVTAQAMKGDREKCIAAGANDYMAKPLDLDQFLSMIKSHL